MDKQLKKDILEFQNLAKQFSSSAEIAKGLTDAAALNMKKINDLSKQNTAEAKKEKKFREDISDLSKDILAKLDNDTLDDKIKLSATCVRVPVKTGHSESINVEFENSFDLNTVNEILSKAPGCKVVDKRTDGGYITPAEAEGDFTTYISRVRKDNSNDKALNLWVVSDNLLKGAALNTVQIAERLLKDK